MHSLCECILFTFYTIMLPHIPDLPFLNKEAFVQTIRHPHEIHIPDAVVDTSLEDLKAQIKTPFEILMSDLANVQLKRVEGVDTSNRSLLRLLEKSYNRFQNTFFQPLGHQCSIPFALSQAQAEEIHQKIDFVQQHVSSRLVDDLIPIQAQLDIYTLLNAYLGSQGKQLVNMQSKLVTVVENIEKMYRWSYYLVSELTHDAPLNAHILERNQALICLIKNLHVENKKILSDMYVSFCKFRYTLHVISSRYEILSTVKDHSRGENQIKLSRAKKESYHLVQSNIVSLEEYPIKHARFSKAYNQYYSVIESKLQDAEKAAPCRLIGSDSL